ncbi:MAG TPA: penicillin-binding protein 2 [Nitrospirales bacterium]|nr:penicillin-binding protein 2 [Nitrospirales bacterium]HIA14003.1 penicillin-binding protein 2 [Nitrospirales bacterium]HIC05197.1 penicillin-binding protein 2 [Nitrospirales bacterium]HIN33232.1 penicillin-binding protein 2 [Nitrospirales bacterium]
MEPPRATQRKNGRFIFSAVCVVLGFLVLASRLVMLQVVDFPDLSREAQKQHQTIRSVEPGRGTIYDRQENVLAINSDVPSLFGDPLQCQNPRETAATVASVLGLDAAHIEQKLRSHKPFVWIKRRIDGHAVGQLTHMSLDGIGVIRERQRVYPNGALLAHVLGFAGIDGSGLEGVEWKYDKYLRGKRGQLVMDRDAVGKPIFSEVLADHLPAVGHDIVLTIDMGLQYMTETALDDAIQSRQAKGGSVIVMDPFTGAILAMTVRPTFDPNAIRRYQPAQWRNRAVTDPYEPGSTFKIVAAAAALNEGIFRPDDRLFAEDGRYGVAGTVLHDEIPRGWMTFSEVIEHSSNIGTVKIAQRVGEETFSRYLEAFGFGMRTGVDLDGESSGILRSRDKWNRRSLASLAIGHEVAVTPLQLITAAAAVANGGFLMRPYVVAEVRDGDGYTVARTKPTVRHKPISAQTAADMTAILSRVVSHGTARKAALPAHAVAGKTGTAQKFDPVLRRYSKDKFVSSFFGFFPARSPQLIILVIIDEPQTDSWGGTVAAPVFRQIAEQAVPYLSIFPDTPERELVAMHVR